MRKQMRLRSVWLACALASLTVLIPQSSPAEIAISINIAPPALPVYEQPPCPDEGYLWTPGYWAYDTSGYYWVPGVWVQPPQVGVLWTPGYWGWGGGNYTWHRGYWGPHVGFYGGINYGFGFTGVGFVGGAWSGRVFRYNTAFTTVNRAVVRNVYEDRTVIVNRTVINNHVSYNGPGGIPARPLPQEQMAMRERHFDPTPNQFTHEHVAGQDRTQFASFNHGRPTTVAMDSVNGRRFNQQGRIANGVSSGQLNAGETRNLEHREAGLNQEIRHDRQANGGALTPQQRTQVNHQQDNLSRSVANDKHNDAIAHTGDNRVGQRREQQQQRVAQGIRSGQMAPAEAARAERTQQNINHQVNADRRANGGPPTPAERHNVNREQNHASGQIHEEKHNEHTAPK